MLTHLLETGMTVNVADWYGCSAGSICATFAAIGVSAQWVREVAEIFTPRFLGIIREDYVCDFAKFWGVTSIDILAEVLGKFINTWEPGCADWTFADLSLKRPGIRLHISATNLSAGKPDLFNAANTPDMRILDAICASSTIPFYFAPWIHPVSGDIYCDGGVTESYPWGCIPNKEEALVIVCADRDIIGRGLKQMPILTMTDYLMRIMSLAFHRKMSVPKFWIAVNNKNIHSIDFHITKDEQRAAFEEGVQTAKGWMAFREARQHSHTPRQHSPAETAGNLPSSADRRISAADHPSPEKTSDNPECHSPSLPLAPPPGLHSGERLHVRRWSL